VSLFAKPPSGKKCLVYCGPEQCDCGDTDPFYGISDEDWHRAAFAAIREREFLSSKERIPFHCDAQQVQILDWSQPKGWALWRCRYCKTKIMQDDAFRDFEVTSPIVPVVQKGESV
jgi:hypothetical protein